MERLVGWSYGGSHLVLHTDGCGIEYHIIASGISAIDPKLKSVKKWVHILDGVGLYRFCFWTLGPRYSGVQFHSYLKFELGLTN